MVKKIAVLAGIFLSVFILSSCTVEIADRPDYYRDYDDRATGAYSFNTSYSTGYYSAQPAAPTATPVAVSVKFITLKVAGNNYYFYDGNREIAVWKFREDGSVLKQGKIINGLVRRFYDGTDITESEIPYKNGERWGICRKFYPNGMLKEKINYLNGDRDGNYTAFYPDGKLMEEGGFKKGSRYGNYKKYVQTGELQEKGVWENNMPRIMFSKTQPTPVPTQQQVQAPAGNDNRAWNGNKSGGVFGGSAWHGAKVAVTAAATAVPAAATQVVIKERVEVPVMITVAVTATPAPVAAEEKHNEAALKQGGGGGNQGIKRTLKEENGNIKEAVKDTAKEPGNQAKGEANGVKDNNAQPEENVNDVKGNTAHAVIQWNTRGKTGWGQVKKNAVVAAEKEGTTKEAKSEDVNEGAAAKEGDKGETPVVKDNGHRGNPEEKEVKNSEKQDENAVPPENKADDK